ncbi:Ig-like domain-containing protein [Cytobacillus dafuensis]|uniref:SbsA Ig-like domain-containing protein n=1 Tax=Cytobacillus dafuensis TaxID=1742359 RepID=A0A5B8Z975_CYTDA|nr:Ig-like domain-containing protein [Cytobacillus dafuensis]QED49672.1 hypothetical protein FSZ17_21695 [Cytobacillus dafuensis]
MRKVKILGVVFLLLLSILVPAINHPVQASNYPKIEKTIPAAGDQHVPIDTDIRIQFNSNILKISANYIKLFVKTNGTYTDLPIKTIRKDRNVLNIIPEQSLEFNKDYLVQINGPAIDLENGTYSQSLSYEFSTNYIDFYELMVINELRLENLLTQYTPREIKAFAPKRYINEINVTHKKPGAFKEDQTSISGITNIDITTKSEDVKNVHVEILKNGKLLQKGYAHPLNDEKGQKNTLKFDIGFSKMPDFFDVHVTALDSSQKIIDSKILKFATEEGKIMNTYKESFKYKTEGKGYTLHELLSKESLFSDFLAESSLTDIKVQVEDK